MVEVDKHEGRSLARTLGRRDGTAQHLVEASTVGEAGQVVVERLVAELPTSPGDDKVIGEESG